MKKQQIGPMLTMLFMVALLPSFADMRIEDPKPPQDLYRLKEGEYGLVRIPDGSFMLFKGENNQLKSLISSDGRTWKSPQREIANNEGLDAGLVIVDDTGELHVIYAKRRDIPQKPDGPRGPAITVMYDLYHAKTSGKRTRWETPKRVFEGYCGAILEFKQLRSGRLIAPFAYWVAGQSTLPWGTNISTVLYSDDLGDTWTLADVKLVAPTYAGYPGSNYGAIEPAVVELEQDGHLYMLLRTETGFQYESYSTDNGTTWATARPSRFHTFNGPALLKDLPGNRILAVWNNSDNIPKFGGKGVYGGRDALQAAISDDYGRTWRGFREIHRDLFRNDTPPRSGDRGTAYANSAIGVDGKIMLITGQGEGRRHIVSLDPEWLTAKHHHSDFSNGLDEWHVFKHFGPVEFYWRDRTTGPALVPHPTSPDKKVLHIRRPDEKESDGAVWNFPNGRSGTLRVRIMLNEGFKGGNIALTDRFFNPSDSHGERLAMFSLPIAADGRLDDDGPILDAGKWYNLEFTWNIDSKTCKVRNNGAHILTLPLRHQTLNGLSYLRLRSMATTTDAAGYYVESVDVDIDDNTAPPATTQEIQQVAANYRAMLSYDEYNGEETQQRSLSEPAPQTGKLTTTGFWIPDKVDDMPGLKLGPFVHLSNGRILTVDGTHSYISADEGKTWTEHSIFTQPEKYNIREERALIQTKQGIVILAFVNAREQANWNWQNDISDSPGAILPTYAVRSLDGGKTWQDPQKLHDEWTGAIRDIVETRDGKVVFTSMMMQHNPGRHAVVTYTSADNGKTWLRSNVIDLGGVGHHAGVMESTLEQLGDGRLWMLLRTNWGKFWQTYSADAGLTWNIPTPTNIDASSAPAMVKRLHSGRLVMVWNRYYPEGKKEYPLTGGDGVWSEVPVSNHRGELSISFSNDDGKSWTSPVVISRATGKNREVSYPYVFEAQPGELWITTMHGLLRVKLYEKDFIEDEKTEYIASGIIFGKNRL